MSKEIYISSTPHETRLAIVENDDLTEIYYERENEYTLAGSIYNGKVTRVLPGMQSSFVDVGLERDAFLYITDFMEEAGDSADFDAADGRSGSRRGGQDERNGSREDRGPRDEAAAPRDEVGSEPVRLSPPTSEPRSDRGDRGDGGRRRRGNREGRSGNREARPENGDRGSNRDRLPATPIAPAPETSFDRPAPAIHSGYAESGSENSPADLGEGAPGADGSRRWRGRRGRRRGRGPAGREESQPLAQGTVPPSEDLSPEASLGRGYQADSATAEDPEENFDGEYNAPDFREQESGEQGEVDRFHLHASSDPSATDALSSRSQPVDPVPAAETSRPDRASRDQSSGDHTFRGRSSSDRGPRDRDSRERDSNDRGSRDREGNRDRGSRGLRAPRGFAPSRALYGVEAAEADQQAAGAPAPEPIILPGESLSKYRKPGDPEPAGAAAAAQTSTPAVRPSTEYVLGAAWDGSGVLPGETLRARSNPGSGAAPDTRTSDRTVRDREGERGRRDDRPRRDNPRDGRGGREDRGRRDDRGDRNRSSSQAAPTPSATFRNAPPGAAEAVPTPAEVSEQTAPAAPAPLPIPERLPSSGDVRPNTQEHTETAEYEPTEASASVRFDPATRSEFRQSAPVVEPVEPDTAPESALHSSSFSVAPIHSPATETPFYEAGEQPALGHVHDSAPASSDDLHGTERDLPSIAHTITPQPEATLAPIQAGIPNAETSHQTAGAHELTSILNTGEMISEAPAPPTPSEIPEPTSPLQHETAVLETSAEPEITTFVSPSHGAVVEEEMLDEEEDFNATTLHASSIEEMDYEEEQTLEGAADLGTMIREMSIDQITQGSVDPEDDDILEEEDATEDDFNDSYEASHDEEEDDDEESAPGFHEAAGEPEEFGTAGAGRPDLPYLADRSPAPGASSNGFDNARDPDRRSGRRDGGRRDGRRGDRGRDRGGDRARSTGGSGDRSTSRPGRRDGRHSAQTTNLPAISDLLKPGQEVLVQIAKEPIAKKGARITSHIALPGRFLVFMPTVNHTGVSRKIESDAERRRLKEILLSEKGEASGGFIVRTAAANASEEELRSDLRFLLNLWADIKQRSESSKSPALIYHDLNLVERILRDQVTDTFSAIWVDTETEYERVLRFLQRFQPSLIRRVKLYTKETPLFEQFGITEEINKALRSKVWLKSGGSIVINQTEALVAIDINTGKFVGKTARLEDTIVKTNLDAIPEIVRQIRLRDLGGIIIIDFIDMDERKNRHRVMAALEEELKKDRAPSKVLQFNDFGLVAITRKRVKQSLERTLSTTCNVCQGTGMTKSPITICNDIYVEMRKMQKHLDRGDVMLRVNPEVVKQLKAPGTKWLQEMEEMVGKTILVKSDPSLHPEQFDIH